MTELLNDVLLLVFGTVSVAQVVEWQREDSRIVKRFKPAPGVYRAPEASVASGQWAIFGCVGFLSVMPLDRLGANAWVAFSLVSFTFVCLLIGTVVWLLMPENLLVPKALRGAPSYLEVRGIM